MTPEEYGVLNGSTRITAAAAERFRALLASAGGAVSRSRVRAEAPPGEGPPVGLLAALALREAELLTGRRLRHRGLVALHGMQRLRLVRQPRTGDGLSSTAVVRSVKPLGAGTATEVAVSFADESGHLVAESTSLLVHSPPLPATARTAPASPTAAPASPTAAAAAAADPATVPDPARVSSYEVARELVAEYAAVSGDHNPIHLSREAARAAGLDDVIAHGMLTFALAGRHVADRVGQERIAELQLRFNRPLHVPAAGTRLTITDRTAPNGALALAATDAAGTSIATGRAALQPPRTDRGTHRA
ncbi:MaoC/PaaZ C-terminal domain-containing protein [Peterkaempfera bronchialis]|uniref:MaoC/PaaZ C-terminal domain-containing protein n=1 Tax=Peterkaempfera bronchialis TaxID=2126346 RepID=UPI003C2D891C